MKVKSKEIYNGLVGIAFETQEKDNLEFAQFVNVQGMDCINSKWEGTWNSSVE